MKPNEPHEPNHSQFDEVNVSSPGPQRPAVGRSHAHLEPKHVKDGPLGSSLDSVPLMFCSLDGPGG